MKKKEMDNYMKQLAAHMYKSEHAEYMNADEEQHIFSENFFETEQLCSNKKIKEQRRKFVYRLVAACAGILLVSGIIFETWYSNSNHVIAGEINWNLEKLSGLDLETVTSSNPYAYKDTENYNNIVNMGPIAIEVLEDKYKNGEIGGINAYLAGAAITDIADIDMTDVTGEGWSRADEFFSKWERLILQLPQSFKEITESENDVETKIERINAYGIYGKFYLQSVEQQKDDIISFLGCKINVESIKGQSDVADKLSDDEYSIIKKYLEKNTK